MAHLSRLVRHFNTLSRLKVDIWLSFGVTLCFFPDISVIIEKVTFNNNLRIHYFLNISHQVAINKFYVFQKLSK